MRNLTNTLVIIVVCALQTSCFVTYLPNSRNIPLLEEKGQLNVGAGISRSGFETQTSVALTKHLGLIANGTYIDTESFDSDAYFLKNYNADIGLGYFNKNDWLITEVYAGYGLGYVERSVSGFWPYYNTHFYGQYQKVFLSPNMGWHWKNYEFGLSFRTSYLDYKFLQGSNPYDIDKQNIGTVVFEPSAVFKFKINNFKYYVQAGVNTWVYSDGFEIYPQLITFSAGFEYNISNLFGR